MKTLLLAARGEMKEGLHLWILAGTWAVWAVAVFACKLDTTKEVGFILLGIFGMVAGAHTAKSVTGTMKGNGNGGSAGGPP